MKKITVAKLYLGAEYFIDEANKTIGAPALSDEVIMNRRNATEKVNDKGRAAKNEVKQYFKEKFNIDVRFKWDIKCGCSMCPCSPGFRVYAKHDSVLYIGYIKRGSYAFNIYTDEKGLHYKENDDYKDKLSLNVLKKLGEINTERQTEFLENKEPEQLLLEV